MLASAARRSLVQAGQQTRFAVRKHIGYSTEAEGGELIERRAAERRVWNDHMMDHFVRLETQIGGLRTDLKADIRGVKTDLGGVETRLETQIGNVKTGLEKHMTAREEAVALKGMSYAAAAAAAIVAGFDYLDKRITVQEKATQK